MSIQAVTVVGVLCIDGTRAPDTPLGCLIPAYYISKIAVSPVVSAVS